MTALFHVSILVVLDAPLRRHQDIRAGIRRVHVSIFVVLDAPLRPCPYVPITIPGGKFQSLLFWMLPFGYRSAGLPPPATKVSILVVLDAPLRPGSESG